MKKFTMASVIILFMLAMTSSYAETDQNYYKRKFCKLPANDGSGRTYIVTLITKIHDKDWCLEIAKLHSTKGGCVTDCVPGRHQPEGAEKTMDELYEPFFDDQPGERIRIYYKHSEDSVDDLESVIIFGDPPSEIPPALVEKSVNELKSDGAREVKVIYPKKKK